MALLMNLDMDLARMILMIVEADDDADGQGVVALPLSTHEPHVISHHVMLLDEADLIVSRKNPNKIGPRWLPTRLT